MNQRFGTILIVITSLLMVLISACARSEPVIAEGPLLPVTGAETTEPAMTEVVAEPAMTEVPTESVVSDVGGEPVFPDFDAGNFDNPTVIDNQWVPMQPGTIWVYEGTALNEEDNSTIDRRIVFIVTDLTKEVEGVRTVVAWIEDFTDGELGEKEIAFYAQDNEGNLWYFGEHPEDYENGKFIEAPTWIAGFEDARPGIVMSGNPQLGMPNIYQGWGPKADWSDYGRVEQMGQETCVPVDCYTDVLVNAEASLSEPDAFQLKYYAPGVGEVRIGWRGDDPTQEQLEMVEYRQLSSEELADIHAQALALEQHAYEVSPDAYGETSPME